LTYKLFIKQYKFKTIIFGETYSCRYDYLPAVFRNFVIEMFKEKCQLEYTIKYEEHSPEELEQLKTDYALCKNRFNGIFGMTYTNPLHEEYIYNADEVKWNDVQELDLTDEATQQKLFKAQCNSVGAYIWGVHTAAIGRQQLDDLITAVGIDATLYCDTDSNYFRNISGVMERISKLSELRVKQAIEHNAYCTINDHTFYLGIIEVEDEPVQEFVTQGAKKYCYRLSDGLHLTLSGVRKSEVVQLKNDIRNFKKGFVFNPAGGITLHYIDCLPFVKHIKGYDNTECDITIYNHIIATERTVTIGSIIDNRIVSTEIDELEELYTIEENERV